MNYKKTSLYEEHEKLSAKIVPFAGFLMPVSYKEGLVGEYKAVRNSVGMFDVSHMGKISLEGENISKLLNYVTVNNVDNLNDRNLNYQIVIHLVFVASGVLLALMDYIASKTKNRY